jgi:hypothetical protein
MKEKTVITMTKNEILNLLSKHLGKEFVDWELHLPKDLGSPAEYYLITKEEAK